MLKTKSEILNIAPYTPGKSKISGVSKVIKLSSNENGLGCSPAAQKAYYDFKSFSRYPDATAAELRAAIGEVQGLDAEKIICGCGSDEVLELLAYAYSGEGDEVIYTEHGFLVYPIAAQSAGAKPVAVPEKNYTTDVDAILQAVNNNTKIVYVANPNNPTGTYIPKQEMQRLRDGLRKDILLVIDAAYAECVTASDYSDGREIVDATGNTIMTRTFSKMYGLAALRLGWGYASAGIIDILNRIRPPFNITAPTLAAGIAAVRDQNFVKKSIEHNTKWREKLFAELTNLGFAPVPSQANFIMAKFGETKEDTAKAFNFIASKGILVREIYNYNLPQFLRISIGADDEMEALVKALREYKAS